MIQRFFFSKNNNSKIFFQKKNNSKKLFLIKQAQKLSSRHLQKLEKNYEMTFWDVNHISKLIMYNFICLWLMNHKCVCDLFFEH